MQQQANEIIKRLKLSQYPKYNSNEAFGKRKKSVQPVRKPLESISKETFEANPSQYDIELSKVKTQLTSL